MTAETADAPQAPTLDPATLRGTARRVVIEAAALAATLHALDDVQWQLSAGTHSPCTTYSDRTGEVATDSRRLRLRAELLTAERVLMQAVQALAVAKARIEAVTGD